MAVGLVDGTWLLPLLLLLLLVVAADLEATLDAFCYCCLC
jgi:hypothetical protein